MIVDMKRDKVIDEFIFSTQKWQFKYCLRNSNA